jgi:hypothetical protein
MIYLLSAIIIFLTGLLYCGYKITDSSIDEHLDEIDELQDEIFHLTNDYEDELAIMRVDLKEAQDLVAFHLKPKPQSIDIISPDQCRICSGTVFSEIRIPEFDVIWRGCKNCNHKTVQRG